MREDPLCHGPLMCKFFFKFVGKISKKSQLAFSQQFWPLSRKISRTPVVVFLEKKTKCWQIGPGHMYL